MLNKLNEAVLAGTGDYDAVFIDIDYVVKALPKHHLLDITQVGSIDLENPWWDKTIMETFDFGTGKVFMINGDICYYDDLSTICLYFNKDLFENTGVAFPYDSVREGRWTFDAFRQIEKNGYLDLNGDGTADEHDRYGYVTNCADAFNMLVAMGELTVNKNDGGELEFNLGESYFNKYDLVVNSLYNSESTVIMERKFGYELGNQIFNFGNTYMMYNLIGSCISYRTLEFDIGVLPFPKYDEEQDKYN